jgi:folate-binding protein YgfZ
MSELPLSSCLNHRGTVVVGGADRFEFLQSLISNDLKFTAEGKCLYAALLTPQGKFLHDLFIYDRDDRYWLDAERERIPDLGQRLKAYKLRAHVTIDDRSADHKVWAIWTDYAKNFLQIGNRHGFTPDPRQSLLGLRGLLPQSETPEACTPADENAYDRHRLRLGMPDGSRDLIVGQSTLAEGNIDLLNGVSWTKGCYVGQELTARIHHRGLVKKRLFSVTIEGPAPATGTPVFMSDQEIGEMRSSNGDLGLALLNIEAAKKTMEQDILLTCSEARLKPFRTDFLKI